MNFTHPLLLAALPLLAGLTWYTARARLGRLPWLRAAVTLGLRLVLVALLVAALAGPQVTQAAPGVTVVFVADQSAGFDGTGTAAEWRWLRAALAGRGPADRASVGSFGTTPAWSGPPAPAQGPVLPSVEGSGSNIEAGLRLALASVPTGRAV